MNYIDILSISIIDFECLWEHISEQLVEPAALVEPAGVVEPATVVEPASVV
jgi:hypothetical protein